MTISPQQAAEALRDVRDVESRSRELAGYEQGARHFFLWGGIWIVGYGVSGLDPSYSVVWLPLAILGWLASAIMGLRTPRAKGVNRKIGFSTIVAVVFTVAVVAVLRPTGANDIAALPPLVLAGAYCIAGVWALPRYFWIGAGIFALTLGGYFLLAPWFSFWMAGVGGGALLLSGLWLLKA